MQGVRKKKEIAYEQTIPVKKWIGLNKQDPQTLGDGESSYLLNYDIFSGADGDYLKSRRGSRYLQKASGPAKYGGTGIVNKITWDVGSEEYLISQIGTSMRAQALITTGNPVDIALAVGGAFALGSTARADLFISGDKLYVMHASGNFVIRWTGTVFAAYPMGLAYPWISTVTSANTGIITGSYTLGIEKVYQVSGVDMMASTPNRRIPTSRILAVTGAISLKKIKLTIQATELDNDTLWTHLRVWRSKNKNSDTTDVLNPIDAQGIDDELYEEALITKAEIGVGALAALATGATLPLGNAGATAGKPGGVYTVELNNADSVLFNLVGIDRIELLPIPACTMGCFCANRVFFSGVQDSALDDASKSNLWYSNYSGTKYAFQYNPLNFVDTGRNGQNMVKILTLEKDVIGIKEGSTGRLPSGNVDIPYQTLDDRIGIPNINFATFVPSIGIVAITSDHYDARIFGYDLRWTNVYNGIDISAPMRTVTATFAYNVGVSANVLSMAYINGKLIISDSLNAYVLHATERKGWTRYAWGSEHIFQLFTFAQGTRAALLSNSSHLIEIEIADLNTDVQASDDSVAAFEAAFDTPLFKSNKGRDILIHNYLSIEGSFPSGTISVYPFSNGLSWPDKAVDTTSYAMTPNASISGAYTDLSNREYRLYVPPSTVGALKWCPMAGNYLQYSVHAASPTRIDSVSLNCDIDQSGMGWGAFDPHQVFPTTNTDPTWAQ